MRARALSPPTPSPAGIRAPSSAALVFLRGRDADARLQQLAALRREARPVLGELATELVARRLHEPLSYRCLGDYSRERLGVGARAVREWARVWRRLRFLPLLRAAVLGGELSWSAARLVVGLAEPETESACLETVRGRTLRAVEQIVRAFKSSAHPCHLEPAESEDRATVRLRCTREEHGLWHAALELARRSAGEQLPTWRCAELVAAEAASALGATEQEPVRPAPSAHASKRSQDLETRALRGDAFPGLSWQEPAGHLPGEIASLARNASSCCAREIDRRLRAVIAFLQQVDFEVGRILRQMVDRELMAELGFAGLAEYARERLDASPRTARRLVALARGEHRAPAVATAFRAGRIHALQAHLLVRAGAAAAWVERAREVTLRRLEEELPQAGVSFHAPRAVVAFFHEMLRRAGSLKRLLGHAIMTWVEQGRQFRDYADFARDGYRCTAPGCTARRNLQSHHIVFRSRGGPDEPWNRTTLCAFHHLRGVHEGRLRVEGRAPDALVFELGTGERFRCDEKLD